uniref:NBS-LRR disease resistance protein NBS52 n=1 Tax=Dimocarpus longan TaxID=128017 RepID=A0A0F6RA56_9ROSI|nr:NBS-LRR disease resistance protein NBS52 [Dimocarpus longan]
MDFVSPVLDVFTRLWDCTANRAAYVGDLQENLNSLRDLRCQLENISRDVENRVNFAEQQQRLKPTNQVKGWLESVPLKLQEVDDILQKGDNEIQQKCMGSCCPRHCCTSYKLGKQVVKKIDVVQGLINRGRFDVVAEKELQRPQIDEIPVEKVVGMDSMFDEVWKCVEDPGVGIIGLYGMGGVGKTTLLKKLNNEFLKTTHNFDVVIWVVVSKEVKLGKIQDTLRNKLQIPDDLWNNRNEEERAVEILKSLRNKRFVLFLDDLWERLDLLKVGVSFPENQNEFKIVFTTRSEEVCSQMGANRKFKLIGLPQEAALSLFRQNVGEDVLNSHHEISKLAEIVAAECDGLPLALVTIGRAMASRKKPDDWRYAIKILKSYPSQFPEMGKYIFPTLRFSYDSLSDDTLKICFLYCSIFPEDHKIENKELVNLWIGEGFFNDFDNVYEAQERGRYVLESLKLACLLEESYDEGISYEKDDHVKMHDVLRDMAQWLAREHGNEILVREEIGLIKSKEIAKWKEIVRVSLNGDSTEFLLQKPIVCARLQTIFVMGSHMTTLPGTLFQSMQNLGVLNLSNNKDLTELPIEIGALKSLYYLNLSKTRLRELPHEVKNLTQLRILLLDRMGRDVAIPPGVISSLSSLEIYSQFEPEVSCNVDTKLLKELECLKKITEIGLTFSSVNSILKFMSAPNLQSCITRLSIFDCVELSSLEISYASMRRMEHLKALYMDGCLFGEVKICSENEVRLQRSETNCFRIIQIVNIWECAMKNLTWLIYTPRLRFLYVTECESLEEIIACDYGCSTIKEGVEIFSNLKKIYFCKLPYLRSICRGAMLFSCLQYVKIEACANLRKLPLNAESAKSLKAIEGTRHWWDNLEWEDEATKHAFTSKFQA